MGRVACSTLARTRLSWFKQHSRRDLASLNLNIFVRHADRVRMANIAQMINVLQAMILTNEQKMVLTPTYYVFKCTFRSERHIYSCHFRCWDLHARQCVPAACGRHRRKE